MRKLVFEYAGPLVLAIMTIASLWSIVSGRIYFSADDNEVTREERPVLFWIWAFAQIGVTAAIALVWWFVYHLG